MKTLTNMKNLIIPEIGNVYKTLFELINLYHVIKQIRSTQEAYQKEKTEHLRTYYSKLHEELTKQITRINNFCTPLDYLSEYIGNRLEECQQIELIERNHLSVKQSIHQICKNHYPDENNSKILNKLVLNNIEGKYFNFDYTVTKKFIHIVIQNHSCDFKRFIFSKNYELIFCAWQLHNGKEYKHIRNIEIMKNHFASFI